MKPTTLITFFLALSAGFVLHGQSPALTPTPAQPGLFQWKLAVPPAFLQVKPFQNGVAAVRTEKGWGIIDPEGSFLVEPEFSSVYVSPGGLYSLITGGRQGLYFPASDYYLPPNEGIAGSSGEGEGLVTYFNGELYGILDLNGREVVAPRFRHLSPFSEGLAVASITGSEVGCVDTRGDWVIQPLFRSISPFKDGLAPARSEKKSWGFIDREGNWAIPARLPEQPDAFRDGLAMVGDFNLAYGADLQSREELRRTHPGLAARLPVKKIGFLRRDGSWALPYDAYEQAFAHDGLVFFRRTGKWGWVDATEGHRVEPRFDNVAHNRVTEGLVAVQLGGVWGFADGRGHIVIPPAYERVTAFSEGLAAVSQDGRWGFIDRSGQMVIPARFNAAGDFSGGLAKASLDGEILRIDRQGRPAGDYDEGLYFGPADFLISGDGQATWSIPESGWDLAALPGAPATASDPGFSVFRRKNRSGFLYDPQPYTISHDRPVIYWRGQPAADTLELKELPYIAMACLATAEAPSVEWFLDGQSLGPASLLPRRTYGCPFRVQQRLEFPAGDSVVHELKLMARNEYGPEESRIFFRRATDPEQEKERKKKKGFQVKIH